MEKTFAPTKGTFMAPWLIGLLVSIGCTLLHAIGMGSLEMLVDSPYFALNFDFSRHWKRITKQTFLITVICVCLGFLHMLESISWAVLFVYLGAIRNCSDALFYSFDTMSTRGVSGIVLDRQWRVLGAVEACSGMLLVGMSTAFLFGIFQRLGRSTWRSRHHLSGTNDRSPEISWLHPARKDGQNGVPQ
ncbi:hypothetical protein AAC691_12515 [Nguyenibacter vanlangensis]|uniref:Uncharacterized protein n=1 Tax=Nguyenibacter vanlangensis TaxID=1216886 RepID=A0ABZ3D0H2_9PROT